MSETRKTVVCIEDEPEMIDLVRLILGRKGFELIGAVGGREGLRTARQVEPDLVLLDLMMPDMDGWEVYHALKSAWLLEIHFDPQKTPQEADIQELFSEYTADVTVIPKSEPGQIILRFVHITDEAKQAVLRGIKSRFDSQAQIVRDEPDTVIRSAPVIVVTAKAQSIDKVLGLHIAKVDDYVTKPFGPKDLLDSVSKVLGVDVS
ncbi:MAG: response regulator [Anaerolineae bacterium]|nr:response regulator [Anaerolineae bacterium]